MEKAVLRPTRVDWVRKDEASSKLPVLYQNPIREQKSLSFDRIFGS